MLHKLNRYLDLHQKGLGRPYKPDYLSPAEIIHQLPEDCTVDDLLDVDELKQRIEYILRLLTAEDCVAREEAQEIRNALFRDAA